MNRETVCTTASVMPLFAIKVNRSADHPCGADEAWCVGRDGYPLVFHNLRDADETAMQLSAFLSNPMIWYTAVPVQDLQGLFERTRVRAERDALPQAEEIDDVRRTLADPRRADPPARELKRRY